MSWNPQEAQYALDRLIARRKIRPSDVESALGDLRNEIQSLRQRLAELESLGNTSRPRRSASVKRRSAKRPRRRLSARVRSQFRLQGSYMGYVRQLTAAQKSQVRKVREAKGWQAAIAAAKKMATM